MVVHSRDPSLDLRHSRLVEEDTVVRDQRLVPNRSLLDKVVTVATVDQHLLPDRNRSAVGRIMECMED